jgi:3-phenylpropionate/trans-cinnamate dioxygenase ferredoxin subunit
MADFVTVARTDDLAPGERMVVELGREFVLLFNVDGQYYAIEDLCSHEEYELSNGVLDGYTLECPKHGAHFDIRTGEHLTPPAVRPVRAYDVRIQDDAIQIMRRRSS